MQQNYIGSMETGPNGSHIHPMLHNRLGTVGGPEIQCLGHNLPYQASNPLLHIPPKVEII